jgi:O-antigen biosynthesis protein
LSLPDEPSAADPPAGDRPQRIVADDRLRYQMWQLRHMATRDDLFKQRLAARRLQHRPVFSIITPVYDTPPYVLRRMLSSVKDQTYPYWEHCLVDDGSSEGWIARTIEREAAADTRIRFRRRVTNGGIVAASNDALALATGAFVVLLDHDDEIEPHALYALACELDRHPDLDMLYSNLDFIGKDGLRSHPHIWPAWSPELLEMLPYTVHISAFRRTLVRELGGFREGLDGAQDYDLMLRVTERTTRIGYVPDILYHWREGDTSAANNLDAKPYAFDAGKRAASDHLARMDIPADRADGFGPGLHRLAFDRFRQPRVSIVVSPATPPGGTVTRSAASTLASVRSIVQRTRYPSYEIVIAVPADTDAAEIAALVGLAPERVRIVRLDGTTNAAEATNAAVAETDGELLVLLGADLEVLTDDWLTAMQGYAQRPAVGAVGPKVYAQNGTIAHAGIVLPRGVPHHVHQGKDSAAWYGYMLHVTGNYAAVSGACMMTRRSLFDEVSGLRAPASVGYSDVDYCLRFREKGHRMVFTPDAELRYLHPTEHAAPAVEAQRRAAFRRHWPDLPTVDPYYSQQFDQRDGQFSLALC